MEFLGYKWVYWMILLPAVLASILIGLCADSGTSCKAQFLDSSWRQVISVVWYTATVRIDNFPPLEPQAQERESNPEPGLPRAAGPEDRETNRPHFSGIKPLRADVEGDNPPRKVD
ncbi:hypothetical protein DSO57_1013793 [Entomophthora muscae]|uniref:Uncharacterized protein n=1 Tax=Entomophthora muscae TaxID=34485 RepID=A0ACC2S7F1_9FUNG|nr:hypothetical protein DSO57_1013793 [Entomophthora muscae]